MILLFARRRPGHLLRDLFSTADAAPVASPRPCEPGPGTLTITDTSSLLSISDGQLQVGGNGPAWGNPAIVGAAFDRIAGRALLADFRETSGSSVNSWVGWCKNGTPGSYGSSTSGAQGGGFGRSGLTAYTIYSPDLAGTGAAIDVATAVSTLGEQAIVLRATGFFHLTKLDGVWRLVWVGNVHALVNHYPAWSHSHVGSGKALRNLRIVDLGGLWSSDYGIALYRSAVTANGATATGAPDGLVEHTITAATGVTQELSFRRTDDDNRWIVRMDQAGGTIKLIERNATVETERASAAQTWTNGVAYRIVVSYRDAAVRVMVNHTGKLSYGSASFNQAAAGVKVSRAGSELVCWPSAVALPRGV